MSNIIPEESYKQVIDRVADGLSVTAACKGLMSVRNFYLKIKDSPLFPEYARAMIIRSHKMFEEILVIADNSGEDTYIDSEGRERVNHENINRARLQVDARKWMLGKMQPGIYGDRIQIASTEVQKNRPEWMDEE